MPSAVIPKVKLYLYYNCRAWSVQFCISVVAAAHLQELLCAEHTGGQIAEVIDIPATMVGKLIGKAGETIKQLQYSTNTKVGIESVLTQLQKLTEGG